MFWKLFTTNLKMILRNRQALFWSFMFPVMFTLIFGLFFGRNTAVGTVGLMNNSSTEIAKSLEKTLRDSEVIKIKDVATVDEAREDIKNNTISGVIVIPENFGLIPPEPDIKINYIYDAGSAQVTAVVTGFLDKFLTSTNFQAQNIQPIFSYQTETANSNKLTYFDFVLAGVLGLALMNSSIIGIAVGITRYREDKILKRITTTPLPTWIFILAEVLSRIILNLAQLSVILILGKYAFDAHIYGNIFAIVGIAMVGALLFQLIGFVLASFAKTTDAAQGMATAITIPMMFLAGVFFPIDQLPRWLYSIVQFLPLAPLLRMIRQVMLEGISPFGNPLNVAIVLIWIIGALLISIWKFRLSEE